MWVKTKQMPVPGLPAYLTGENQRKSLPHKELGGDGGPGLDVSPLIVRGYINVVLIA